MDPTGDQHQGAYTSIIAAPTALQLMTCAPQPALARWVSRVWTMHGGEAPGVIRSLPDGCIDIIVDFTTPGKTSAFVAGLQSKAGDSSYESSVRAVAVRLRPGAALALLDTPVDALTDGHGALESLLGRGAQDLEEQISAASSQNERILALEAFLIGRFSRARMDARVERALTILDHTAGAVTVSELSKHVGTSPRTLDRLFYQWVGTSPKRFARIMRFQQALARAEAFPMRSWARIAAELGFSDQAHLTRDFVHLTGVPPGRLLGRARLTDLFKPDSDAGSTERPT